MRSRILSLLAFALISVSGSAIADPTLLGPMNDPTGLDGLVVDGTTYNVTFSTTIFDSPNFTQFPFGSAASHDAAGTLLAALNSLGVTEIAGVPVPSRAGQFLVVDNTFGVNDAVWCIQELGNDPRESRCSAPPRWFGPSLSSLNVTVNSVSDFGFKDNNVTGTFDFFEAALFAPVGPTGVPEPATLSLLGLGLVAVGFMRRRTLC